MGWQYTWTSGGGNLIKQVLSLTSDDKFLSYSPMVIVELIDGCLVRSD